jgi:hypothetical protein
MGSFYQKMAPMVNTLVKEHFWTYEFLKTLKRNTSKDKSIGSKHGISKTFEDL